MVEPAPNSVQFPKSSLEEVTEWLASLERVEREHLDQAFPNSTIRGEDDRLVVSDPDGRQDVFVNTYRSVLASVWINGPSTKVHGVEVGDRFADVAGLEAVTCEVEAGESYLVRCGPPDGWDFNAMLPRNATPDEGPLPVAKAMALVKRRRVSTIEWTRPEP